MAGLAGLALTVPTFAASTKKAENQKCCAVTVDVADQTVTAGGAPARLAASVSRSANGCTQVRRTVVVRLDGLDPDLVRIERVVAGALVALPATSTEDDTVQAVDPLADSKLICGVTTLSANYRVTFLDDAPTGSAEFAVAASKVNGKLLGSDVASSLVVEAAALPGAEAPAEPAEPAEPPAVEETAPPPVPSQEPTEEPSEEATAEAAAPPAAEETTTPPFVAPEPEPAPEQQALSSRVRSSDVAWLAGSTGLALAGLLVLGVLWQLRRRRALPAAEPEAAPAIRPGLAAELAELTTPPHPTQPTIEVNPDR
ncbi:hypothetical protein Prum_035430 [Phytohabitans rumicis]|uniref:Uncharacterized protein n=1 Tax=Phytohabitans rumicis TaxID=1076125 RepID=A0A6V8L502_9ACTN|nr:hypothetical protein Prum_035430 [Phytohabitans rumicis]